MNRFIESHQGEEFDILIVGGGITGAAVAYEAASRGLEVALVEKSDFGGATSAATSKMIHGGFRYLTKFEIGLVRESLRERRTLMNIASNFVHPLPFVFTHYKGDKYHPLMVKAGMIFYDLLSFDKNHLWDKSIKMPWHKSLSSEELIEYEPEVLPEGLKGGNLYYDGMNFYPERLTLAFIKSAVNYGAKVSNYTEVIDFLKTEKEGGKIITGVKVIDKTNKNKIDIRSKLVINCAGPWADIVLNKLTKQNKNKQLRRSEGIHIITKKKVNNHVITATTKSGRHCFFVPWRGHTLIGTTDKEYIGNPDEYKVTKSAIKEMLDEVNPVFGNSEKITFEDVQFAYGGLRPLVEDDTKESYESSRKYEISTHDKQGISGLLTIEGGKYTTSRNLAQKVVDKTCKELKKPKKHSVSNSTYLVGSDIKNIQSFITEKQKQYSAFDKKQIEFLVKMYGTEIDTLLKIAEEDKILKKPLNGDGEIAAQVVFGIRNEMAKSLPDILFRRTGLGTLGHPGNEVLEFIADIAAKESGWNISWKKEEIEKVEMLFVINDN
ncbi:MAG: glycerol-3-phosphate dehydrogenase/oxidase [Mariniphaga sp.]|nr:glycerol-3-phosphate dehydrogenase/oxidase [Mariniphaga sp.]